MALHTKHKFVSAKADGTDNTLVKPTNWNDEHDVTTDAVTGGVVLGRPEGSGPGPIQDMPYSSVLPAGIIMAYGGAAAPTGWLLCDGRSVLRSDYPNLFAAIGTTYGAADGLHFSVPDLRGRVPCGLDGGTGRISAVVANAMGAVGGQAQTRATGLSGYVDVNVSVNVSGSASVSGGLNGYIYSTSGSGLQFGGGGFFAEQNDLVTVSGTLNGSSSGSGSGSGSGTIRNDGNNLTSYFNTVQPTIAMNYIIRT